MQYRKERQTNQCLRGERLRRHWSQQDLADQLGTTVTSIKRWERKATTPSAYFRLKLTTLFGKSAQELGLYEEQSSDPSGEGIVSDNAFSLPDGGAEHPVSAPSLAREQNQVRMIDVVS